MALKLENFNRGKAAIEEAMKSGKRSGGFAPQINWKDGDEKYVIFLNDIEETPVVLMHEWIEAGTKKFGEKEYPDLYFGICRTDPVIGEDHDALVEKGSKPKKRSLSIAVVLEPIMKETGRGRARPEGFRVATQEYDRKTDDGTETVTAPVIGIVTQSQGNFFNILVSNDESEAPIRELPLKIKRIGGDGKTVYNMTPYVDMPVDLSDLLDNLDGISYLSRDENTWDELQSLLEQVPDLVSEAIEENVDLSEDDRPRLEAAESAHIVAVALLEKYLNELADADRFNDVNSKVEKVIDKFDKGGNSKQSRPDRPSQRSSSNGDSGGEAKSATRTAKFGDLKAMAAASKK